MKKCILLFCFFFSFRFFASPDTYIELTNGIRIEFPKAEVENYHDYDNTVTMGIMTNWERRDDVANKLRNNGVEVTECYENHSFWSPTSYVVFMKNKIHEWHVIHDKDYIINGGR